MGFEERFSRIISRRDSWKAGLAATTSMVAVATNTEQQIANAEDTAYFEDGRITPAFNEITIALVDAMETPPPGYVVEGVFEIRCMKAVFPDGELGLCSLPQLVEINPLFEDKQNTNILMD